MIENQSIIIKIKLKWSDSYNWNKLASGVIKVPKSPGVYEVFSEDSQEPYHIGMAGDLNRRILKQLTGKGKHSTRNTMINNGINLSKLQEILF
jgi:excinuclease UvrABC nuclease subunit